MRVLKVKPYTDLILDVNIVAGSSIEAGLRQMIYLRNTLGINVRTTFNNVHIFVCRDDQTVESLYQEYRDELKKLGYVIE
jgi:hypothetical protein